MELRIARSKADAGLYDQALGTLRDVAAKHAQTPEALDAYFLMGAIQASQKRTADAIATYIEVADRFKDDPRAAEAVFRRAALTLLSERNGKESEARALYTNLIQEYPRTSWAPRALLARGEIEQQQKLYERDAVLAASVPTALITYRELVRDYPDSNATQAALARLGSLYEQVKRYDLAAETFVTLAMRYPTASSGLWFRAGEIYRRRLKDSDKARAAYQRVEATSPHYEAAQNRLR